MIVEPKHMIVEGDAECLVHVLSRLNRTHKMQKSEILLVNLHL